LRLALLAAVLCLASAWTVLSGATAPTTAITVVNNSSLEIRHLYLSPADNDNWGPDQLNQSVIAPGQSVTINAEWNQATVKVISEDQNGCFLYQTLDATGNASWTITSNAVPDCGN
jgi:hypothetical protein